MQWFYNSSNYKPENFMRNFFKKIVGYWLTLISIRDDTHYQNMER